MNAVGQQTVDFAKAYKTSTTASFAIPYTQQTVDFAKAYKTSTTASFAIPYTPWMLF